MSSSMQNGHRYLALAIAFALAFTGCGGGGGGYVRSDPPPGPPVQPPPPPPPPVAGDLIIDVPAGAVRGEPNGLPTAENLIKEGEGWLWLGGTSTFTESVQINAGMLSLLLTSNQPSTLVSDVYINPAGRLDHDGIITGSVFNRGKMVVWNPYNDGVDASYGHPQIGGDYIQDGSATLVVMLNSDLRIAGDVTLNGGTLEIGLGWGNASYSLTPQILHADGSITGQFGNVVLPSVFLSGTVNYGAHDITMTLTPQSASSVMSSAGIGDPVTLTSAANLDAAFAQANALAALPPAALTAAQQQFLASARTLQYATGNLAQAASSLDSLSGQAYAGTFSVLLDGADRRGLVGRLAGLQGPAIANAWLDSRVHDATLDDAGGMRANVTGDATQVGIHQAFGDSLVLGIAGGHSDVRVDFDRQGDQSRMQLPSVTAYAQYRHGAWHATGLLGQARASLSMQRRIDLGSGGIHRAGAEWELDKFGAYVEGGRAFRLGRGHLTPFVGVAHDALHSAAFAEHGDTGFELIARPARAERTAADLGVRLHQDWRWGGDGWARMDVDATYRHHLQASSDIQAAFAGAPGVLFDLPGMASGGDTRTFDMALGVGRGETWSGFARYHRSMAGDDDHKAWWLGARWAF